jgi:single-stranded DNA-binding protein
VKVCKNVADLYQNGNQNGFFIPDSSKNRKTGMKTAFSFPNHRAEVANLSVATNHCNQTQDRSMCIETTWHRVTAWEVKEQIQKGCGIHVIGRLRRQKYVAADGTDRIVYDILA